MQVKLCDLHAGSLEAAQKCWEQRQPVAETGLELMTHPLVRTLNKDRRGSLLMVMATFHFATSPPWKAFPPGCAAVVFFLLQ